jgi:polysaccharide biosynthesis/export protein
MSPNQSIFAKFNHPSLAVTWIAVCVLLGMAGCRSFDFHTKTLMPPVPGDLEPPRELSMVSLPMYRVESPDVLQIDVIKMVPRPPYHINIYDLLMIKVVGTIPESPIENYYLVDEEGMVDLGPAYGKVQLRGLTPDEATTVTTQYLKQTLNFPIVSIQLARTGGTQEVSGTYLVQQDGVINLRQYGVVPVLGKTLTEIQEAINKQLEDYFDSPQVTVEVVGYNSKKYSVIREDSFAGDSVAQLTINGNETVLDAISAIGGLPSPSSHRMWIARPAPGNFGCEQILPIDYLAITRDGICATNYQMMPGDRLFIAEDRLLATANFFNKMFEPVNVFLYNTQLGSSVIRSTQIMGRANTGTRF